MTEVNKFKIPPRKPVDPELLAKFAAGAEEGGAPVGPVAVVSAVVATPTAAFQAPTKTSEHSLDTESFGYPWIGLDDKRRTPAFSMRLTEAEQAKLKYLSKHTPYSMHEICVRGCRDRIEQLLKSLPENHQL